MISTFTLLLYLCIKCLIQRSLTCSAPFFSRNNDVHSYNTRKANNLHVPFARTHVRKFSTKINGALVWNSLPDSIRNSKNLNTFKKLMKDFLIAKKSNLLVSKDLVYEY